MSDCQIKHESQGFNCENMVPSIGLKVSEVKLLSRVQLLVTPWTVAYQAPPSMGFSRQEYWSAVPLSSLSESESEVTHSCPTLCNPMDCSLPGSSLHGILQARVLKWVAISFSRGSSRPRKRTQVSCIAGRRFTI